MGLKQRTDAGAYVKLSEGKFYLAKDETKTPYTELEGTLTNIYTKDDVYEGKPVRKLYLVMNDGDQNLILNFRFDSRYCTSFMSFVMNADLKQPFTIIPKVTDKVDSRGEKFQEMVLLLKQNGQPLKGYFTKDNPNGLPPMKKVRISGKDVWDKTDMLEFFENLIENKIKPQLSNVEPKISIKEEVDEPSYSIPEVEVEETDELPWEK